MISYDLYRWFDYGILVCIIISSITLALQDFEYTTLESKRNQILDMIGIGFAVIFILEAICKIVAMGFALHQHSYLRDAWNILDFVIVVSAYISLL